MKKDFHMILFIVLIIASFFWNIIVLMIVNTYFFSFFFDNRKEKKLWHKGEGIYCNTYKHVKVIVKFRCIYMFSWCLTNVNFVWFSLYSRSRASLYQRWGRQCVHIVLRRISASHFECYVQRVMCYTVSIYLP